METLKHYASPMASSFTTFTCSSFSTWSGTQSKKASAHAGHALSDLIRGPAARALASIRTRMVRLTNIPTAQYVFEMAPMGSRD